MTLPLAILFLCFPQAEPTHSTRAPEPLPVAPEALPQGARHAGIYHVQTQTWTRRPIEVDSFGPDVVYNNTALSGYFTSAGTVGGFGGRGAVIDEGAIPGTGNGLSFPVAPDRDAYWIQSVEIGYCDNNAPGTSGWRLEFYQSYRPCEFQPILIPDGAIEVNGLPAGGGCWVMELDLSGGGEFEIGADGGAHRPGWDDDHFLDSFGWSMQYTGPGNQTAGFMLAGDPLSTDPLYNPNLPGVPRATDGTGTYFGPPSLCNGAGTGFQTIDIVSIRPEAGSNYATCNTFFYQNVNPCTVQNGPFSSFHLRMTADPGGVPAGTLLRSCSEDLSPGTSYCATQTTSEGREAFLCMTGSTVAADDDVQLYASKLPIASFGFFITSTSQGFVSMPGNSRGNLCLGGDIGRFVGPGQVRESSALGRFSLDTRIGEWSVTAIPSSTGNYAASAGTTTYFQAWFRDIFGNKTSNFTNGYAVTWE